MRNSVQLQSWIWTEFIHLLSCKANPKDALQDCICCPEFGAKHIPVNTTSFVCLFWCNKLETWAQENTLQDVHLHKLENDLN